MSLSVLYDVPGPKARMRSRVISVVGILLIVSALVLLVLALGAPKTSANGAVQPGLWDATRWNVFTDVQVWRSLGQGVLATLAMAGVAAAIALPLGVSAVTVGFGMLLTMYRPFGLPLDLRTSPLLVPVAQAVVAVPLVVRTVLPVLRSIDTRLHEAAAVLGASPGTVLRRIDWPVAARSVGLAVGLAFAVSLGEFGATSFLARPDSPTLPVLIYRLLGRPGGDNLGVALAASVLLAVLTGLVMALAERLRGSTGGDV